MAVAALLTAGFALGVLAVWCTPVLPTEQFARSFLTEQLQNRQNRPYASGHHHRKG